MIHANHEYKYPTNNVLGVFVGTLIGGLAGAATMLLLAPQSGKVTRTQIQEKVLELRDRTTGSVEDRMPQVRTKANKLPEGVGLKDRSQELALEQWRHVTDDAAQAGKKAIRNS